MDPQNYQNTYVCNQGKIPTYVCMCVLCYVLYTHAIMFRALLEGLSIAGDELPGQLDSSEWVYNTIHSQFFLVAKDLNYSAEGIIRT